MKQQKISKVSDSQEEEFLEYSFTKSLLRLAQVAILYIFWIFICKKGSIWKKINTIVYYVLFSEINRSWLIQKFKAFHYRDSCVGVFKFVISYCVCWSSFEFQFECIIFVV